MSKADLVSLNSYLLECFHSASVEHMGNYQANHLQCHAPIHPESEAQVV